MAKTITLEDALKVLKSAELADKLKILSAMENAELDLTEKKIDLIYEDYEARLIKNNINSNCPHCKSDNVIKKGMKGRLQRFLCKDCNKKFTLFTNTMLEKTKYPYFVWVDVVEAVLNNTTIEDLQARLNDKYAYNLDYKTVFNWVHKVLNAMANMSQPILNGVVQADETFVRESQKGSRHLENRVSKKEKRSARYGYKPSKNGVMSAEFATVTCLVDETGHTVAKVSNLGKLTSDTFYDAFEQHLGNVTYFCSDGNFVYKGYCDLKHIPLYIKPSKYLSIIQSSGIVDLRTLTPSELEDAKKKNMAIISKLYKDGAIDYISGYHYSYDEFINIKKENNLSLARVNQYHAELKEYIVVNRRNVSTEYLNDYVGAYTYMHNWGIDNGHKPVTHTDAETILIELLKGNTHITNKEINSKVVAFPKPTGRYEALLKERTEEMRKLTGNRYFKFDPEDNVSSFDLRQFLDNLPQSKFNEIRRKCKSVRAKWVRYAQTSAMLKEPNIKQYIADVCFNDGRIDEEDKNAVKGYKFSA